MYIEFNYTRKEKKETLTRSQVQVQHKMKRTAWKRVMRVGNHRWHATFLEGFL